MNCGLRKIFRGMAVAIVVFALAIVSIVAWQFRGLARQLRDVAAMDGKMVFYGKVVDHQGEPVSGAKINYLTNSVLPDIRASYTPADTRTDESGEFKIGPKSGIGLSIQSIEKENYRFATAGYALSFRFGITSDPHIPDPNQPVPFLMVPAEMKFTDIVRPHIPSVVLHWNSAPVEVPLGGTGEVLILRLTRDMAAGERKGFAWKVEIEIRNGELLMREKKDLIPLAPVEGYQKQFVIGYDRDAPNWGGGSRDLRFIFKTHGGNYGRLSLSLYPDREDGRNGALVQSVSINPGGERSLD